MDDDHVDDIIKEEDIEEDEEEEEETNDNEAQAKVPSLLDLNPFDVKGDEEISSTHDINDDKSDIGFDDGTEIPFRLKKKHLYTAFRLHYSYNSVIVKPFRADFFTNPTVQLWLRKAKEFNMRQAWNGVSVGMMLFTNYATAHEAIGDLRLALGTHTEVEVRHSAIKADMPYRYPHEEVEFLMKERSDHALMPCVMVLEGLPEDTTEEDLGDLFPDARTVVVLTNGEDMKGYGLVEFPAPHKLRDAMNDFKKEGELGSKIEVKGQEVVLSKFMSRYNQATSWLRSHPPKAESKTNLEDEDRIELCKNLKSIAGEREIILNNTDVSVADGVELYWTLTDKMHGMMKKLSYDTEYRQVRGIKNPESKECRINPISIIGYHEEQDEEITAATGKVPSLMDVNFFAPQGNQPRLGKRLGNYITGPQQSKQSLLDQDVSPAWNGGVITQQIEGCDGTLSNRSGPVPLMDISSTTDLLTQSMFNVSSGKGNMPSHVQSLASTIQKASEVLQYAGRNPQNVLSGPLETVKWCKMPLPLKKPLEPRSSDVEERLYIDAYPRKFDDRILENIMCRFGGLIDAYFSKGSNFGYAKFADRDSAQKAILVLNDQTVAGSRLQVRRADPPVDTHHSRHSSRRSSRSSRDRDRDRD